MLVFTSDVAWGETLDFPLIRLYLSDGQWRSQTFPNQPWEEFKHNKGDAFRFTISGFGFSSGTCVTYDSIDRVLIMSTGNDGWNIESAVTALNFYAEGTFQLLTADFQIYSWIDGNGYATERFIDLTKA